MANKQINLLNLARDLSATGQNFALKFIDGGGSYTLYIEDLTQIPTSPALATQILATGTPVTGGGGGPVSNPVTVVQGGLGADNSASTGIPIFATGVVTITPTTGTGNVVRAGGPTLTGNVDLDLTSRLRFGGAAGNFFEYVDGAGPKFTDKNTFALTFNTQSLSASRVVTWPDAAGTVTLLGNSSTGSGAVVLATSPSLVTPVLGAAAGTSLSLSGTAGAGFIDFPAQSAPPGSPSSGYRAFADATGHPSWIRSIDGFVRTFSATITAQRTWTLPDATGTIILDTATQTLTNKTLGSTIAITAAVSYTAGVRQTFAPNGTTPGFNVGSNAGDPSTPSNGDVWYDSTGNLLRARINGATVSLGGGASAPLVLTGTGAADFAVGPNGNTNPVFRIVDNVASQATGLSITGNAGGAGVTLTAISSGTDEPILLVPKGTGAIVISGSLLPTTIQSLGSAAFPFLSSFTGNATQYESVVQTAGVITHAALGSATDVGITINTKGAGKMLLGIAAAGSNGLVQFGGATSSFPALGFVGAELRAYKADLSSFAAFRALGFSVGSSPTAPPNGALSFGSYVDLIQGDFTTEISVTNSGSTLYKPFRVSTIRLFGLSNTTSDLALTRNAASVVEVNNGTAGQFGWFIDGGIKRVSTQFDKAANTTLGDITGLSVTLIAGRTYSFEATLHVTADVVGGSKFAIAGTATATSIIYEIVMIDNTSNANTITSRQTALAGSAGQAGTTSGFCRIKGTITVNAAGTLTVQFAQNAAAGTSSVLVGSDLIVRDNP